MKKKTIRLILTIVMYIFLGVGLSIGAFGTFEEIFGRSLAKNLLATLHIPPNITLILLAGLVCIAIAFIAYYLREKFYKDS